MCGIIGCYSANISDKLISNFEQSIESLFHRGPDDFGSEKRFGKGNFVLLGHTRLSIIDLTKDGHQPFKSDDGRYTLIFNGEIYNYQEVKKELQIKGYKFKTKTDTEVLLKAWAHWQSNCLKKLDGMFAFAIYDRQSHSLTLVRDPYGIKPIYYYCSSKTIYFASEINSLKKFINEKFDLNKNRIFNYLVGGINEISGNSFYEGIKSLMPGNKLEIKISNQLISLEKSLWYELDIKLSNLNLSFNNAVSQVREIFLESVKRQIRSDVPLGVTLSGGIDSSSIVCAIKNINPDLDLQTFSYLPNSKDVNEEKWINIINENSNGISNKIYLNEHEIDSSLDNFIFSQDEPIGGLSFFAEFLVFKKAKEKGIKVMLDGHGADEMLGGYSGYPQHKIRSYLENDDYIKALVFSRNWSKLPGMSSMDSLKNLGKGIMLSYFKNSFIKNFSYKVLGISPSFLKLFKNLNYLFELYHPSYKGYVKGRGLCSELAKELMITSCPPQLRSADRSAMFHSIENRVPFLNPTLVNFMLSLPENYLVSEKAQTKSIFREAMIGIVPNEILNRKDKIGYQTPSKIRKKMTPELKDLLISSAEELNLFNIQNLIKFMIEEKSNTILLDGITWRLYNLLKWRSMHY